MKHSIVLALVLIPLAAHAGDPKAGAPSPPAKDAAKQPAPPAKEAKLELPKELPKPPQELVDLAKAMSGAWKCTGQAEIAGQTVEITGAVTHTTNIDGWWISSSISGSVGKLTTHSALLTTYDVGMKKFYRVSVNGRGGHSTLWGTPGDKKITWDGDARWNGNDVKVRGTDDIVSATEAHLVGEYSKDGGKTWSKEHEITCKKNAR